MEQSSRNFQLSSTNRSFGQYLQLRTDNSQKTVVRCPWEKNPNFRTVQSQKQLAPVVQTLDSVIHRINHCLADKYLDQTNCVIHWKEDLSQWIALCPFFKQKQRKCISLISLTALWRLNGQLLNALRWQIELLVEKTSMFLRSTPPPMHLQQCRVSFER